MTLDSTQKKDSTLHCSNRTVEQSFEQRYVECMIKPSSTQHFKRLVSRLVRWCSEAGPAQPLTLYQNGAWFVIGRKIIYDLVLICKKQFIKFFVKQRSQRQKISVEDTSEVAVQVREFVEAPLQTLSHDLLYLRGVQYEIRLACPYCQLEKCSGHNQMACTHDDCLHLLELKQGVPLIFKKKPSEEILAVSGQEKWFSQVPSEVGGNNILNNVVRLTLHLYKLKENHTIGEVRYPQVLCY